MARVPNPGDGIDRSRRQGEEIRQKRMQRRCHSGVKTVFVGGDIDNTVYIGGFYIGVNSDLKSPEEKLLLGFCGHLETVSGSSVQLAWYLNGSLVEDDHEVDTTPPNKLLLDNPIRLSDLDILRVVVVTGIGSNLSAGAILTSSGR